MPSFVELKNCTESSSPNSSDCSIGKGSTCGQIESTYLGYVRWNGATEVTGWNVYVGTDENDLRLAGRPGCRGFETRFNGSCWAEYVQTDAVESDKEVRRSGG